MVYGASGGHSAAAGTQGLMGISTDRLFSSLVVPDHCPPSIWTRSTRLRRVSELYSTAREPRKRATRVTRFRTQLEGDFRSPFPQLGGVLLS
jgi:hypothetical protein